MSEQFIEEFLRMQRKTHYVARQHGFQEIKENPLYVPTALGMIMSEGAEAMEAHREGRDSDLSHELADIVIRTMDLAESLGINLAKAIVDKNTFNQTREYKHGNKRY